MLRVLFSHKLKTGFSCLTSVAGFGSEKTVLEKSVSRTIYSRLQRMHCASFELCKCLNEASTGGEFIVPRCKLFQTEKKLGSAVLCFWRDKKKLCIPCRPLNGIYFHLFACCRYIKIVSISFIGFLLTFFATNFLTYSII